MRAVVQRVRSASVEVSEQLGRAGGRAGGGRQAAHVNEGKLRTRTLGVLRGP